MHTPATIKDLYEYVRAHKPSTTLNGSVVSVAGSLYLRSLTSLPDGVTLSADGSLDLSSLTSLPDGVTLSAGGSLYLFSLTSLRDGVTLSAGGSLYLSSLTSEDQTYAGQHIRLRMIDGYCTRLIASRDVGGVTLWSAQYFRGHLDTDRRCYVAQSGDMYAHGTTAEKALRDLRFKIAQVDYDASDLVAQIKKRGTVTFNDYRLITGACEEGLSEGLRARGIDPATEELPLQQVLDLCRGGYGGETFHRAIAQN